MLNFPTFCVQSWLREEYKVLSRDIAFNPVQWYLFQLLLTIIEML